MKVQLKTIYAGPDGVHQPGSVIEVDAETGAALIDGGYAVAVVKASKVPAPPAPQEETGEPGQILAASPTVEATPAAAKKAAAKKAAAKKAAGSGS